MQPGLESLEHHYLDCFCMQEINLAKGELRGHLVEVGDRLRQVWNLRSRGRKVGLGQGL